MRVVAARVTSAGVTVAGPVSEAPSGAPSEQSGTVVGAIDGSGLLLLVGITHSDTEQVVHAMAAKVFGLRILRDEESCATTGAPILVVSQFTLYGRTAKGRRPSWSDAAPAEVAEGLFDEFVVQLRRLGAHVETGVFGAQMAVTSVNDGPFTVILEM